MAKLLKLTEAASIGIHAMAILAGSPGEHISTHEIADILNASSNHLAKVMGRMETAGFVKAQRGPGGGYRLSNGRENLKIKDVYEAVEGPLEPTACLLKSPICGGRECIFGDIVGDLDRQFREYLATTSLSDIAINREDCHA